MSSHNYLPSSGICFPHNRFDCPKSQQSSKYRKSQDLIKLVRTFQWEDWRELRFVDVTSEGYRRAVARLAKRLVEANRRTEETDVPANALQSQEVSDGTLNVSPGLLDQLAKAEETLPEWRETIEAMTRDMELIGQVMEEEVVEM
jgi:hypothetical protein